MEESILSTFHLLPFVSFPRVFAQFSSVTQSFLTLSDPMDHGTPGFPVHHQLSGACSNFIESVMPSNNLILCRPLLLLPSVLPSIRVFSKSQFFTSYGQSVGALASASVLPMNIQDWSPLGRTGWISLQSSLLQECTFSTFKTRNIGLSTFPASMSLFLSLPTRCSIYKNSYVFTLPRKSRVIITPQS